MQRSNKCIEELSGKDMMDLMQIRFRINRPELNLVM